MCSRACGYALGRGVRPPIYLVCEYCGREFKKRPEANRTKYCSQDCRYAAARIEDLDRPRNSYRYRQWRRDVLMRDNYLCQHCGSSEHLQAHHIKGWKEFPDLRYTVENGVTLCVRCHAEEHGGVPTGPSTPKRVACARCDKPLSGRGTTPYCRGCTLTLWNQRHRRVDAERDDKGRFISEALP